MLESTIDHLVSPTLKSRRSFEILIVDDGSTDGTSGTALGLAGKYNNCDIKVVTLEKNLGKGGAVRHGMLYAGGKRLLMADADGASRIEDLEQLWKAMDEIAPVDAPGVVVGSRAHLVKSDAVVKVTFSFIPLTRSPTHVHTPTTAFTSSKHTDVRIPHHPSHFRCRIYPRYPMWLQTLLSFRRTATLPLPTLAHLDL
jgi:glycosyltransferase involved in cell wall biosynthesis